MLIFIYLTVLLSTVNCFFPYDPNDDVFRDEPPEDNRRMIAPEWWPEMVVNRDNFDDIVKYEKGVQRDGDDDDDDDDLDPVDLYLENVINSYPKARDMFDTLRLNDEVNDLKDRTYDKGRKGHGVAKASANRHRDSEMLEKNESVKGEKKNKIVISNESPSRLMGLDRLSTETLGPQGTHIFTGENEDDEDDDNDYEDDDDEDVKPVTLAKKKENSFFDNPMYKWWSRVYERTRSGHKQSSTTEPSSTKTDKIDTEKTPKKEMSFDDEDEDDDDDDDDDDVSPSSTTEATINNSTQATTTVRPSSSSKTSTSTTATTTAAATKSASTTASPSPHGKNKTTSTARKNSKSRKLKTTPSVTIESVLESSMNKSNPDLYSSNSTLTTTEPTSSSLPAERKSTDSDDSDDLVEIFLNSLYHESDKPMDGQHNISTTISSQSKPKKASQVKHSKSRKTSTSPPPLTTTDSAEQLTSTTISATKSRKHKNSTLSATLSDDDFPTISVTRATTTPTSDLKNSTTSTPSGSTIDDPESTTLTTSSPTTTPIPTLRAYTDDEFNEDDSDLDEDTIRPLWNPDLFP